MSDPDTAWEELINQNYNLREALKPFAAAYWEKSDPGTWDLDNKQPVAWHVELGAWRLAALLVGRKK